MPWRGRRGSRSHEIAGEPLIGVAANDPYGEITARPFATAGCRAGSRSGRASRRPSSAWCATASASPSSTSSRSPTPPCPGIVRVPLVETVPVSLFVAQKAGRVLSSFADYAVARLREEVRRAVSARPWRAQVGLTSGYATRKTGL